MTRRPTHAASTAAVAAAPSHLATAQRPGAEPAALTDVTANAGQALPVTTPGAHSRQVRARLHRAGGQLAGATRMYDTGRSCVDVLDQLSAAAAAVDAAALLVLEDQLDACLRGPARDGDEAAVEELAAVLRRYVRCR